MTMNFARLVATSGWSGVTRGNSANTFGLETAEAASLSMIPRQSTQPRLVCTWQVDPVGRRPIAVWSTRA
jgi:hypothetical protein